MAVPNSMQDLATLASSNSPAGAEAIGNSLDNYLRSHAAIIRSTNALASATVAAASTTDIGSADAEAVQVTGSATITSFGTGFNGCRREVRFSGACTLTNSGNIILPGGVNITTAAGDVLTFRCTGSGVWTLTARAKPAITSGDVTSALGYTPANKAGDTFLGGVAIAPAAASAILTLKNSAVADASSFIVGQGLASGSDNVGFVYNRAAADMVFGTNNAERMRLTSTGLFGIGITPVSTLHLDKSGDNYVRYSSGGALRAAVGITAGGGSIISGDVSGDLVFRGETNMLFGAGAAEKMRINSSGVSATNITLGGGKLLSLISVSNAAPGAMIDGQLHLRY